MYVDIFSLNAFLTHYSRILTHYLLQFDTKCRPFANFRAFYIYFSTMIRLNDPFYQRQSQAPAAFLRCVPGIENGLELRLQDAFARIRHINPYFAAFFFDMKGDAALPFHGIDSILAQVFNHPGK